MSQQLFREKSLERVSSPEQLNEYIRVSSPGVWLVLGAIIALLAGVCVWGVLGRLDTTVAAVAVAENGEISVIFPENHAADIAPGMSVRIGEAEFTLKEVNDQPARAGRHLNDYALYVGGFDSNDWVRDSSVDGTYEDGIYAAEIVIDSVAPMSFVLN